MFSDSDNHTGFAKVFIQLQPLSPSVVDTAKGFVEIC